MLNGKGIIIHLIVGLIKKTFIKMSQYFPKLFNSHFGHSIKVKIDLEVDKLDIDKLVPLPVDLSKLNDVVKSDV